MIAMKKYYEVLALARLCIEIDDIARSHCDLSRIKIKVYEYGTPSPCAVSKFHANSKENKLIWEENLQLRFTGQKKLAFQVYCEPQGQQNAPIQPLFRGVYYITPESLTKKRNDTCHVYSPQGEKQGILRWDVSRVTREEEEVREEEAIIQKPLFPENLIGIIRIFEATLEVSNSIFNKKKHPSPSMVISFGQQNWRSECVGNDYNWRFNDIKIEYLPESSQTIEVELLDGDLPLLNGSISCDGIRKLKRYVRQSVSMFNKNQIKVGSVSLEVRYMDKEELIAFVYSPHNNPNFTKRYLPDKIVSPSAARPAPSGEAIVKRNKSFLQETRVKQAPNRYALHKSDLYLPKTARFPSSKPSHPYVSYIDPERSSDFSPKRKHGWDMSLGRKFDFTRQYRGNPGVGSYKLPSIFGEH